MRTAGLRPAAAAIAAAALFGAGVPLAKVLVGQVEAIPLAALLYLGSGAGLFLFQGLSAVAGRRSRESGIGRSDLPWLAGATLAGGVLAPIALMTGLRSSPAATASLLLNLEGAATALLAAALFREHLGGRTWAAVLLVTGAGMVLSCRAGTLPIFLRDIKAQRGSWPRLTSSDPRDCSAQHAAIGATSGVGLQFPVSGLHPFPLHPSSLSASPRLCG